MKYLYGVYTFCVLSFGLFNFAHGSELGEIVIDLGEPAGTDEPTQYQVLSPKNWNRLLNIQERASGWIAFQNEIPKEEGSQRNGFITPEGWESAEFLRNGQLDVPIDLEDDSVRESIVTLAASVSEDNYDQLADQYKSMVTDCGYQQIKVKGFGYKVDIAFGRRMAQNSNYQVVGLAIPFAIDIKYEGELLDKGTKEMLGYVTLAMDVALTYSGQTRVRLLEMKIGKMGFSQGIEAIGSDILNTILSNVNKENNKERKECSLHSAENADQLAEFVAMVHLSDYIYSEDGLTTLLQHAQPYIKEILENARLQ